MRDHPFPTPPAEDLRTNPAEWLTELRHILFEGTGPGEGRIETLIDRMERRR